MERTFIEACRKGDRNTLVSLSHSFESLTDEIHKGFHIACIRGHFELVECLIHFHNQGKIELEFQTDTILSVLLNRHFDIVKLLIEFMITHNPTNLNVNTLFKLACKTNAISIVDFLLNLQENVFVDIPIISHSFIICCELSIQNIVERLLSIDDIRRIDSRVTHQGFICACKKGHIAIIDTLLQLNDERRIDIHLANNRPLFISCQNKKIEIVNRLLSLFEKDTPFENMRIEHPFELKTLIKQLDANSKLEKLERKQQTTSEDCGILFDSVTQFMQCEKIDHHVFSTNGLVLSNNITTCPLCAHKNNLKQIVFINQ